MCTRGTVVRGMPYSIKALFCDFQHLRLLTDSLNNEQLRHLTGVIKNESANQ